MIKLIFNWRSTAVCIVIKLRLINHHSSIEYSPNVRDLPSHCSFVRDIFVSISDREMMRVREGKEREKESCV